MPSSPAAWSAPRTWFLTVRLLEVSAVLLVVGTLLTVRTGWQQFSVTGPSAMTGADGEPLDLNVWEKIAATISSSWYAPVGPVGPGLVVGALLVLVPVVVLLRVRPVSQARLLRWEVAAVGAAMTLVSLFVTLAWVLVALTDDPFRPRGTITEGGTSVDVDIYNGPGRLETALMGVGLPVVALVILAIAALWWVRLPRDFEDEAQVAAAADVAGVPLATAGDGPRPAPRRSWRPAPAPDANVDDILLDGVEQIDPVERLHPRDDGEGATSSGYEDWFRRF